MAPSVFLALTPARYPSPALAGKYNNYSKKCQVNSRSGKERSLCGENLGGRTEQRHAQLDGGCLKSLMPLELQRKHA